MGFKEISDCMGFAANSMTVVLGIAAFKAYFKIKKQLSFATLDSFHQTKILTEILRPGYSLSFGEAKIVFSHFKGIQFQIEKKSLLVDEVTKTRIDQIIVQANTFPNGIVTKKHLVDTISDNSGVLRSIVVEMHSRLTNEIAPKE